MSAAAVWRRLRPLRLAADRCIAGRREVGMLRADVPILAASIVDMTLAQVTFDRDG